MQTEDGNIRQLSGSEDDLSTTDKTEVRRDIASKARPGIAELFSTGCASLVLSHYKQHQGDRVTYTMYIDVCEGISKSFLSGQS